jgi:hypothetical protein
LPPVLNSVMPLAVLLKTVDVSMFSPTKCFA